MEPKSFVLQPNTLVLEPKSFVLQPKRAVLESRVIVLELGAVDLEPKNFVLQLKTVVLDSKSLVFSGKPTRNSRVTGSSRFPQALFWNPKALFCSRKPLFWSPEALFLSWALLFWSPKNSFCNRKPLFWRPKTSFFSGKPTRNSRVTGSSRAESKKDVFLENQPVTLELRVLKERSGILVFLKAPVTLKLREDNSEITGFPVYETNICIDECLFDRKIIPDFWNLPFFMLSLKMARQTPTKYNPFFPRLPNKKVEMAST